MGAASSALCDKMHNGVKWRWSGIKGLGTTCVLCTCMWIQDNACEQRRLSSSDANESNASIRSELFAVSTYVDKSIAPRKVCLKFQRLSPLYRFADDDRNCRCDQKHLKNERFKAFEDAVGSIDGIDAPSAIADQHASCCWDQDERRCHEHRGMYRIVEALTTNVFYQSILKQSTASTELFARSCTSKRSKVPMAKSMTHAPAVNA